MTRTAHADPGPHPPRPDTRRALTAAAGRLARAAEAALARGGSLSWQ